jgi:hypothetical protein
MQRLLVLANFELAFDCPEGTVDPDQYARLQERRILRALERICSRQPGVEGSVERLEYESFAYGSSLEAEPLGYYYNKHERAETS